MLKMRLMSYNIGGGRRHIDQNPKDLLTVIESARPDLLAVQEAWESIDQSEDCICIVDKMAERLGVDDHYFGPTISLKEHFHVAKSTFIEGIFNDWKDWRLGNGLVSARKFIRLGNTRKTGHPYNLRIFHPASYEGTRDTDPRYVILGRIALGEVNPFVVVTHLTTLVGEPRADDSGMPGKMKEAQLIRQRQAQSILDLITEFILKKNLPVILMGDLNAQASEPCLANTLLGEGCFIRLEPVEEIPTHPKAPSPIDHILVFPGKFQIEYQSWVMKDKITEKASDHLPVIADVIWRS